MRLSVLLVMASVIATVACEGASERQAREELERIAEEREREQAAAEREAAEHLMTFGFAGTEPDASAPAADLTAPESTQGPAAMSDAERFVRWLYAGMASGDIELTSAEDAASIWTAQNARQFQALSEADRAFLTENPLCGCDDAARVAVRSVTITPSGANAASARVALTGAGFDEVTLALAREADGWRLADVEA